MTGTRPGRSWSGAVAPSGARRWRVTRASSESRRCRFATAVPRAAECGASSTRRRRMSDNDTPKPQPPANLARPDMAEKPTVILGGGPAGLTAGYLLSKKGLPVVVLEAEDQVGGIAKTAVRDGYRFDLGGHRFFTKVKEVDDLWHEIMREEFLERPRMSRIYWRDRKGRAKFLD